MRKIKSHATITNETEVRIGNTKAAKIEGNNKVVVIGLQNGNKRDNKWKYKAERPTIAVKRKTKRMEKQKTFTNCKMLTDELKGKRINEGEQNERER